VGVKNQGLFSYLSIPPPLNPLPPGEGKEYFRMGTSCGLHFQMRGALLSDNFLQSSEFRDRRETDSVEVQVNRAESAQSLDKWCSAYGDSCVRKSKHQGTAVKGIWLFSQNTYKQRL